MDSGNGTLVMVTSDHGEEFLEHGYVEHGRSFYQEITRVPVIISGAGVPSGVRSDRVASQMDLFPTVLEIAGISFPEELPGIDLLDDDGRASRSLPASGVNTGPPYDLASMREGPLKLVWNVEYDTVEMYDLDSDPGEMARIPADPGILESAELYWTMPPVYQSVRSEMEVGPALRDLGYL